MKALIHTAGARGEVYRDVDDERERQDAKWGGPDHDDEHDVEDWVGYINDRTFEAFDHWNALDSEEETDTDRADCRRKLIQVAALAIAAVESFDRKGGR